MNNNNIDPIEIYQLYYMEHEWIKEDQEMELVLEETKFTREVDDE